MLTDARTAGTFAPSTSPPRPPRHLVARGQRTRLAALRAAVDALDDTDVAGFCAAVESLRNLGVGLVAVDGATLALSAGGSEPLTLPIRDARRVAPALRRWLAGLPPAPAEMAN